MPRTGGACEILPCCTSYYTAALLHYYTAALLHCCTCLVLPCICVDVG
jgi:hypothetical protein